MTEILNLKNVYDPQEDSNSSISFPTDSVIDVKNNTNYSCYLISTGDIFIYNSQTGQLDNVIYSDVVMSCTIMDINDSYLVISNGNLVQIIEVGTWNIVDSFTLAFNIKLISLDKKDRLVISTDEIYYYDDVIYEFDPNYDNALNSVNDGTPTTIGGYFDAFPYTKVIFKSDAGVTYTQGTYTYINVSNLDLYFEDGNYYYYTYNGGYDESNVNINCPWDIRFLGVTYPGNECYIHANSYVVFGEMSVDWSYDADETSPPVPRLNICADDVAQQRVYVGTEGTAPNRIHRVVREGSTDWDNGVVGEPSVQYELIFYENEPDRIDINIGINETYIISNNSNSIDGKLIVYNIVDDVTTYIGDLIVPKNELQFLEDLDFGLNFLHANDGFVATSRRLNDDNYTGVWNYYLQLVDVFDIETLEWIYSINPIANLPDCYYLDYYNGEVIYWPFPNDVRINKNFVFISTEYFYSDGDFYLDKIDPRTNESLIYKNIKSYFGDKISSNENYLISLDRTTLDGVYFKVPEIYIFKKDDNGNFQYPYGQIEKTEYESTIDSGNYQTIRKNLSLSPTTNIIAYAPKEIIYLYDCETLQHIKTIDCLTLFGTTEIFDLAISDNYIVFSDSFVDTNNNTIRRIHVYDHISDSLYHTFIDPAYTDNGTFGSKIKIKDNIFISSDIQSSDFYLTNSGKVFVFDILNKSILYNVECPDSASSVIGVGFGSDIELATNKFIVAAPDYSENATTLDKLPKFYVFELSTGNLLHTFDSSIDATLLNSNLVSIDDNYICIGGPYFYIYNELDYLIYDKLIPVNNSVVNQIDTSGGIFYFANNNNSLNSTFSNAVNTIYNIPEADYYISPIGSVSYYNTLKTYISDFITPSNEITTSNSSGSSDVVDASDTQVICGMPRTNTYNPITGASVVTGEAILYDLNGNHLHTFHYYDFVDQSTDWSSNSSKYFGEGVSISDRYIAIATTYELVSNTTIYGAVYIFDANTYQLIRRIQNPLTNSKRFGVSNSLKISGDYIAIADRVANRVFVYCITDANADHYMYGISSSINLGYSVDLVAGDYIANGTNISSNQIDLFFSAPAADYSLYNSGSIFHHRYDPTTNSWSQIYRIDGTQDSDGLGNKINYDPSDGTLYSTTGTYIFKRLNHYTFDGVNWILTETINYDPYNDPTTDYSYINNFSLLKDYIFLVLSVDEKNNVVINKTTKEFYSEISSLYGDYYNENTLYTPRQDNYGVMNIYNSSDGVYRTSFFEVGPLEKKYCYEILSPSADNLILDNIDDVYGAVYVYENIETGYDTLAGIIPNTNYKRYNLYKPSSNSYGYNITTDNNYPRFGSYGTMDLSGDCLTLIDPQATTLYGQGVINVFDVSTESIYNSAGDYCEIYPEIKYKKDQKLFEYSGDYSFMFSNKISVSSSNITTVTLFSQTLINNESSVEYSYGSLYDYSCGCIITYITPSPLYNDYLPLPETVHSDDYPEVAMENYQFYKKIEYSYDSQPNTFEIVSGELPEGLNIDLQTLEITGIPVLGCNTENGNIPFNQWELNDDSFRKSIPSFEYTIVIKADCDENSFPYVLPVYPNWTPYADSLHASVDYFERPIKTKTIKEYEDTYDVYTESGSELCPCSDQVKTVTEIKKEISFEAKYTYQHNDLIEHFESESTCTPFRLTENKETNEVVEEKLIQKKKSKLEPIDKTGLCCGDE